MATALPDLTAAILVGGLGTRLRPIVGDRPKPLAEIHSRPFLAYLLDQLAMAGLQRVVLCTGYRAEQVKLTFGDHYGKISLDYSPETEPLGTAGALRLALPLLTSDTVLVMNGDSICECDLGAFWRWHLEKQANQCLLLTRVNDTSRYGQVTVDDQGRITRFIEKGDSDLEPGWINAGVYFLSHSTIATIPSDRAVSLEREVFPSLIGHGLYGYQGGGRFIDIGTPDSYALAGQFFSSGNQS